MTTETLTLSAFLLERIAEDEREAQRAGSFTPWDRDFETDNYGHLTVQPARVLATCKAHRAIVENSPPLMTFNGPSEAWELRALASIYADDPAFREEWRV